jgi:HNH endonuclease
MAKTRGKKLDFEVTVTGCFISNTHFAKRVNKSGTYSSIKYRNNERKVVYLHRFIYEEMYGPIPADLVVRHTCDNSHCINPEHMLLGTRKQNTQDAIARGRHKVFGRPMKGEGVF